MLLKLLQTAQIVFRHVSAMSGRRAWVKTYIQKRTSPKGAPHALHQLIRVHVKDAGLKDAQCRIAAILGIVFAHAQDVDGCRVVLGRLVWLADGVAVQRKEDASLSEQEVELAKVGGNGRCRALGAEATKA